MFQGKHLAELTFEDISLLVKDSIPESRSLEYKSLIHVNTDKERKEFLADISSLANAGGGHLLFGIEETDRIATDIPGVEIESIDEEILRLDSVIRDGIEPRLPSVKIEAIATPDEKHVIIIEVLRSWRKPHMVTFKNTSRFFSRNSAGKYQLDVNEIRTAFTATESIKNRIESFRVDRLERIASGETPVPLEGNHTMVIHLIPFLDIEQNVQLNLQDNVSTCGKLMKPIIHPVTYQRYNFDGYITYSSDSETANSAYVQLMRNGSLESVSATFYTTEDSKNWISATSLENQIFKRTQDYLELLQQLQVEPPLLLYLSFVNVKGFFLYSGESFFSRVGNPIDRQDLFLPEVLVEDYGEVPQKLYRPVLDALWNACGWSRCMHYNESGRWDGSDQY